MEFSSHGVRIRPGWSFRETRRVNDMTSNFTRDFHRSGLTLAEASAELGLSEKQVKRLVEGTSPVRKLVAEKVRRC